MKRRVVLVGILLTAFLMLVGCLGSGNETVPTFTFTLTPTLTLNPNSTTPLAALVELSTDQESTVEVTISDGTDIWVLSFDDSGTDHSLPLLGFKPDRTYTLLVQAIDITSSFPPLREIMTLSTDPLPAEFPEIVLESSIPERMEPGYTMFRASGSTNYAIIVDGDGEVVWFYLAGGDRTGDLRKLENGNLQFTVSGDLLEMDMLGNIEQRYSSIQSGETVPADVIPVYDAGISFHHEVYPTSDGTYIAVSHHVIAASNFPTSYTTVGQLENVDLDVDDTVEFSSDGTVLYQWSLHDILDPFRIGYDSLKSKRGSTELDWTHANAVIHDERDDSLIVSVRHQDAVVKFSRTSGELIWILGNHENWATSFQQYLLQPVGTPFEWQYHQHAPVITPSGNLLLFDNGNHRTSPYDGNIPMASEESYSRAVAFSIDEVNMTVEQIWEYGSSVTPAIYAASVGDADYMESTGNVLITFGDIRGYGTTTNADLGKGAVQFSLVEVDPASNNEVVFDLNVFGFIYNAPVGWRSYRSERIPGLY